MLSKLEMLGSVSCPGTHAWAFRNEVIDVLPALLPIPPVPIGAKAIWNQRKPNYRRAVRDGNSGQVAADIFIDPPDGGVPARSRNV